MALRPSHLILVRVQSVETLCLATVVRLSEKNGLAIPPPADIL